ncbi:MAG: signal peptidase II [Patescibacteria group bacterium]|nr:signal peptidase II [Patescibacteria group bacterium]
MNAKVRLVIILSGGLFLIDRLFKWLSANDWAQEQLINNRLGWLPSVNHGIAFGLPIPSALIIILSVPLLALVIYFLLKQTNALAQAGLFFILLGALSNLFDRIFYQHTLDYFLVLTSLFNLADVMIVVGVGLCLWGMRKKDPSLPVGGSG